MKHHNEQGISFIELLTALIIFGILCGYGLSLMPGLYKKNQLQVTVDEIKEAIHYAKTEALLHAHTVTLAPLSGHDDWSAGIRLFVDNKIHAYTPETTLIREWHWRSGAMHVTWHGFESTHYLRFSADLMSRGCSGHFIVEDARLNQIKLVVNRLGRIQV